MFWFLTEEACGIFLTRGSSPPPTLEGGINHRTSWEVTLRATLFLSSCVYLQNVQIICSHYYSWFICVRHHLLTCIQLSLLIPEFGFLWFQLPSVNCDLKKQLVPRFSVVHCSESCHKILCHPAFILLAYESFNCPSVIVAAWWVIRLAVRPKLTFSKTLILLIMATSTSSDPWQVPP